MTARVYFASFQIISSIFPHLFSVQIVYYYFEVLATRLQLLPQFKDFALELGVVLFFHLYLSGELLYDEFAFLLELRLLGLYGLYSFGHLFYCCEGGLAVSLKGVVGVEGEEGGADGLFFI